MYTFVSVWNIFIRAAGRLNRD